MDILCNNADWELTSTDFHGWQSTGKQLSFAFLAESYVGFSWFKCPNTGGKSWEKHEKKQEEVGRCSLTRWVQIPLKWVAKTNPFSSDWIECPGRLHWVPFVGEHTVPIILCQPTDNCCVLINCVFLYCAWFFLLWWQLQGAKLILRAEI